MLRIIQSTSAASEELLAARRITVRAMIHWPGAVRARSGSAFGRRQSHGLGTLRQPQSRHSVLTQRQSDRRIGYDFNFHVPKSISIVYGLTKDERILIFRESVDATMQEMEGKKPACGMAATKTGRPATWWANSSIPRLTCGRSRPAPARALLRLQHDVGREGKPLEGRATRRLETTRRISRPSSTRFARALEELGLPVERKKKGWEPDTSSGHREVLAADALIEKTAKERGITDAAEKDQLGAKTRERKQRNAFDEQRSVGNRVGRRKSDAARM